MSMITIRLRCACGCGEKITPGRDFKPGHDQRLRILLENKVGGLLVLKALVEKEHGRS